MQAEVVHDKVVRPGRRGQPRDVADREADVQTLVCGEAPRKLDRRRRAVDRVDLEASLRQETGTGTGPGSVLEGRGLVQRGWQPGHDLFEQRAQVEGIEAPPPK